MRLHNMCICTAPPSSLLRSFLLEAVRSQAVALQAAAASLLQHVYSEAEIDKQTNIQALQCSEDAKIKKSHSLSQRVSDNVTK